MTISESKRVKIITGLTRLAGVFVFLISAISLTIWVFNIQYLQVLLTRNILMPANAALVFTMTGFWMVMALRKKGTYLLGYRFIAFIAVSIGLITFGEYFLGWDFSIDRILYPDENFVNSSSYLERMAPLSALNFMMLGVSLFLRKNGSSWLKKGSDFFLAAIGLVSLLSLLGYLYGGIPFFGLLVLKKMSIESTFIFLLLVAGLLLESTVERGNSLIISDSSGGKILRLLLPSALLVPMVLGWLRLQGEQVGLYNSGFGVSLTVVMNVSILTLLIYWTATSIYSADLQRLKALDSLRQAHDDLELRVRERTAELSQLTAHLQTVREDERIRISREIHDELGQELTGLKMDLSWMGKKLLETSRPAAPVWLEPKIETMSSLIDRTIQTVRKISQELRPGILDTLGLDAALEWQAQEFQKRTGILCDYFSSLDGMVVERAISTEVFRIFQELLTNIARHANAKKVQVDLNRAGRQLILEVNDNGKGISPEEVADSKALGLLGMRERAHLMGGELGIEGRPGIGTTVKLVIPLQKS